MDDPKKRGKRDRKRVNVKQAHEVYYWSRKLGCTAKRLRAAVREVGPMVADVRVYLLYMGSEWCSAEKPGE